MGGSQTIAVAPQPWLRLGTTAHQPGDISLPRQRTRFRLGEDQFERGRCTVLRPQLPVMVMVAKSDALARKAGRKRAEFAAERPPAGRIHIALFRWNGGHEELVETQQPAGGSDLVRPLPQRCKTDMRRRALQAARVELRL